MRGIRLNQISILVSIVGVIFIMTTNFAMHEAYLGSTGETQALFGVGYLYKSKYYAFGLFALIFPIINMALKRLGRSTYTALILALFTLALNAIPLWRVGLNL